MNQGFKRCNGCHEEKPFSAFSVVKPGRGDSNNLASRCKQCRAAKNLQWHRDNPVKAKANRKNHYIKNTDKERLHALAWRTENKKRHLFNYKNWAKKNRAHLTAKVSMRKTLKQMLTPAWLNAIDHALIQEFYEIASARTCQTGVLHHVDHIIPINGEGFNGLHVPWNLRVITAFENVSKKNRVIPQHAGMFWGAA